MEINYTKKMFYFTLLMKFFSRLLRIVPTLILLFNFFQLDAQDYKTVKAKHGDGIYSVLKRNGYSPGEFLDPFIELNKDNLGKNNSLIIGRTYRLPLRADSLQTSNASFEHQPGSSRKVKFDLFGEKYSEVNVISDQLKGAVYYLESGHGGPDPGAIGVLNGHRLCEDEYAYDVTLRLARNLIENGATVYMIIRDKNDGIRDDAYLTPDRDEVCYPDELIPLSQLARLRQSTRAVNNLYLKNKGRFQRLVVIHVDSRNRKENIDVFFYHDKQSTSGEKLANTLRETFEQKYAEHQPNRGYSGDVSERNLYVIKNSYPTAVFIEIGNINHRRDQRRLIIPDNRQALANWMCEGLIKDFRNNSR